MKAVFLLVFLSAQAQAALWIYYPAAYATHGDKSDGVDLVEATWLFSAARNDRQIYTLAYTLDKLDGDNWKYTQHSGLIAATWPLGSMALSAAALAVNGKLGDVPQEFAPLNKGALGAARLTKQEGRVKWGLFADSYDEPSGLHIRHGGVLSEWRASRRFTAGVSALAALQNGRKDRYSTTIEAKWEALRSIRLQADFMFGETSLPFSWSTLIMNNTPAMIDEMWGVKCDWSATSCLRLTAGYRFTGYENADADYVYAGIQLRFLAY